MIRHVRHGRDTNRKMHFDKQTTKGVWLWGKGERGGGGRKKTDADYDTSGLLEGGVRVRVRVKNWLGVE